MLRITHYALRITIALLISLTISTGYAYAWNSSDHTERLSSGQSNVFSPGYINAAKQQAMEVSRQANQSKSWWDKLVDTIKNKMSSDVVEDANTKVKPELKKKTSSKATTLTNTTRVLTADELSFLKGTGTAHGTAVVDDGETYYVTTIINAPGHLGNNIPSTDTVQQGGTYYWEEFDGVRYIYAGTAGDQNQSVDVIKGALALARRYMDEGKTVGILVASGKYGTDSASDTFSLMSNMKVYGGYDADGMRDITTNETILNAYVSMADINNTEINGFTISNSNSTQCIFLDRSYDISIINNKFINTYGGGWGNGWGIKILDNSNITISNNEINANQAFWDWGTYPYFGYTGPIGDIIYKDNALNTPGGAGWGGHSTIIADTGLATGPQTLNREFTISESSFTTTNSISKLSSDYRSNISSSNIYGTYSLSPYGAFASLSNNSLAQNAASSILRSLLSNKNALAQSGLDYSNEALIGKIVTESLGITLGVPSLTATEGRIPEMQVVLALADILRNPTEDQKLVLDAVEGLLKDMKNIQDKAGVNTLELTKAENDLLQMVANVLLAQGVPGLLKAGDIEGIKGIFKDLGQSKDSIMLDYTQSIKPYYNNIVKELTANLAILQLKGMLSKKITEEELRRFEPREIDKIIENIRKANDKSFELEYILQQDAKYRKEYLDPSNKALEDKMKKMMRGFTSKLNKALEDKR